MAFIDEVAEVARKTMTLFFMVDKSGSMFGQKIGDVNDAVTNVLPIISDISDTNPDAEIKVAAMEFSNGVDWLYNTPKAASEFIWQDVDASGLTSLGAACLELNSKLSRSGFMQTASGSFAPVIILLSDGEPTDDYIGGLSALKANKWFKNAIKIAIAIGDDANTDTLAEFTGSKEAIFYVHNIEALKQVIRIVAVTSSQIGSKSSNAGATTKQEQVQAEIKDQISDVEGAQTAEENAANTDNYDDWA